MESKTEPEFGNRVLQQFMDLYILPEIRHRQELGLMQTPISIQAAQIIFYPDARKPLVRINSEIKAIGQMKLKPRVAKNAGELILDTEVEGLTGIKLSDETESDCGHATLVRIQDRWTISFDFRYNKGFAKKLLAAAQQFLDAAAFSLDKTNWAAFADNLFSASELLAKATLCLFPDPQLAKKASHRSIQMKFNRFADLGNVKVEHKKALNKLSGLRDQARYVKSQVALSQKEAANLLQTVQEMAESVKKQLRIQ